MRIYLDNCCFNRPFDDQRQPRIHLEAEAKLFIQENIRAGGMELAWSYVLDYENGANPFPERRRVIGDWQEHATVDVEETRNVLDRAHLLVAHGLKAKDALHVACAISAGCARFVTTDDYILKRGRDIEEIIVVDPLSSCQGDESMKTDTEIRTSGLQALVEALGCVDAERFVSLVLRERFDYTEWQRDLWPNRSVDEISMAAMELRKVAPNRAAEPAS